MKQVVIFSPNSANSNQNSSTSRLHSRRPSCKQHPHGNPLSWLSSRRLKRLLIFLVLCFAAPLSAKAASVTLAWDLKGQSVDGCKVFMRSENQAYDYSQPVWAGAGATCTVDGLQNAQKYFFVARVFQGTDESGDSNEVFCTTPLPPNQPPVADAGPDVTVDAGASVTLNGAGSSDADGSIVSYAWTQTDGPAVETAGATDPQMTITIPSLTEAATLVFRLDVTDDRGDTSSDTCQVSVSPVAAPGGGDGTGAGGTPGDYADSDTVVGEDTLYDIIIDDGDAGATRQGNWGVSKAGGAYGTRSMYSRDTTATYTFEAQVTGTFEVSVWWTQLDSRSDSAPIEIYDGANLLEVVHVNQKIDGGQWNVLGTYQFSDYPKVVIVSTGNGSTCADAVEFMEIPPEEPAVPVVVDYVIDDGDAGATGQGSWSVSTADGAYGSQSLFSRDPSATYTFQAPTAGRYQVSVWWTQLDSRSDSAPIKIYDGADLLEVVNVNQKIDGGQWNVLGTYQFSDYPKVVIVSTGNGSTCADAVEFTAAAPVVEELIVIDDGDTGAIGEGRWSVSNVDGAYGTQSLFTRDSSAIYTFQAQTTGRYAVSLWWTQYSSRSDDVPVEIYDGSNLLGVVRVNQKQGGGQWNILGTYQFSDYPKVVIVSTGNGSTCADAVQLVLAP